MQLEIRILAIAKLASDRRRDLASGDMTRSATGAAGAGEDAGAGVAGRGDQAGFFRNVADGEGGCFGITEQERCPARRETQLIPGKRGKKNTKKNTAHDVHTSGRFW